MGPLPERADILIRITVENRALHVLPTLWFRQISPTTADGARAELQSRGLYLDLPPWGYHVFELTA